MLGSKRAGAAAVPRGPTRVTPADPPPPLSAPLSLAGGVCARCGRPWRFELRAGSADRDGHPLRCAACGQVLGVYALGQAGMLWLRLAAEPDGAVVIKDSLAPTP